MKSSVGAIALTFVGLSLVGCANNQPADNNTASTTNPTDRTYSRKDINHSGRQQTGEAIQALDPSVTTSGNR